MSDGKPDDRQPVATHELLHIAPASRAIGTVLAKDKLRAVLAYIHENLDGDLPLVHLAGVAHVSPYHFARLFKNSTGLPPHQYVITRRIERAKELLRERNIIPLAEVAVETGFANQSHFTHHFKRLVGVTPRLFQASARTYPMRASS
jgi:AraC family transcriptional regulator